MKVRIGIAEDKRDLRKSIQKNLALFNEVEIAFIAIHGEDVLKKTDTHLPDVILMDIEMPVMNGIEATKRIKEVHPDIKILMLTVFDQDDKIMQSILAGANGYLLKEERPSKIVEAVQELMTGGAPMTSSIALKTLQLLRETKTVSDSAPQEFGISERELQVLSRLSKGMNYNQVAENLFISPKTVRNHIQNIYSKLQVHGKVEAINAARKLGWLS